MWASAVVYTGIVIALAGLIFLIKPVLWFTTSLRCLLTSAGGLALAAFGLVLPASESRVARPETRLDEFAAAWQFHEFHVIRIAAPPERAFAAIKSVKANEIFLFNALMRIRRAGRPLEPGIRELGEQASLVDVATQTSFLLLADVAPHELVIGTAVIAPPGQRGKLTAETYNKPLPPGFALATMNFLVTPDGDGSRVSTETRVFANDSSARRRFAAYWRLIYPGSALIRRMWLRAIKRRAEAPPGAGEPGQSGQSGG